MSSAPDPDSTSAHVGDRLTAQGWNVLQVSAGYLVNTPKCAVSLGIQSRRHGCIMFAEHLLMPDPLTIAERVLIVVSPAW